MNIDTQIQAILACASDQATIVMIPSVRLYEMRCTVHIYAQFNVSRLQLQAAANDLSAAMRSYVHVGQSQRGVKRYHIEIPFTRKKPDVIPAFKAELTDIAKSAGLAVLHLQRETQFEAVSTQLESRSTKVSLPQFRIAVDNAAPQVKWCLMWPKELDT